MYKDQHTGTQTYLPGQLFVAGRNPELLASRAVNVNHLTVEAQLHTNQCHKTTSVDSIKPLLLLLLLYQ